jgi:RHS repeat-associated protein
VRNEKGVRQPIRFQGQYHDEETGLYYNRWRFYDPLQGRYITQDPIGLLGGMNGFSYPVNPVKWVDPLGLRPIPPTPKGVDPDDWACEHGDKLACGRNTEANKRRNAAFESNESDGRTASSKTTSPAESGEKSEEAIFRLHGGITIFGANGTVTAPGKDGKEEYSVGGEFFSSELGAACDSETETAIGVGTLKRAANYAVEKLGGMERFGFGAEASATLFDASADICVNNKAAKEAAKTVWDDPSKLDDVAKKATTEAGRVLIDDTYNKFTEDGLVNKAVESLKGTSQRIDDATGGNDK